MIVRIRVKAFGSWKWTLTDGCSSSGPLYIISVQENLPPENPSTNTICSNMRPLPWQICRWFNILTLYCGGEKNSFTVTNSSRDPFHSHRKAKEATFFVDTSRNDLWENAWRPEADVGEAKFGVRFCYYQDVTVSHKYSQSMRFTTHNGSRKSKGMLLLLITSRIVKLKMVGDVSGVQW